MNATFAVIGNHDNFPNNDWNFKKGSSAAEDSMALWKPWMDADVYKKFQ